MPQTTLSPVLHLVNATNVVMSSSIEEKLESLLVTQTLGDITPDLCDFSLEEQNATAEARGIQPTTDADFIPILGKTVTYIVACVLLNRNNEVLAIQEAKPSCAGKWYLPAGRMEKGESICEAAIREVYEETGLNVEITTLLAVETAGGSWFRFVLTGRITGGTLKTLQQADRESLQAKWVTDISSLPLRSNDILNLVELGRSYHKRPINTNFVSTNSTITMWHGDVLPTKYPHHKTYLRVVAAIRKRATNKLHILVSEKNAHHFPTVEVHPQRSLHSTLRKFMIELFGAELPQHRPHGLFSVEHNAGDARTMTLSTSPTSAPGIRNNIQNNHQSINQPSDGICLNVLVIFWPPLEEVALIGKCTWQELSKDLEVKLNRILASKHSTIPLHVIR